ncbi:MAG: DNA recombination protein RmuC [Caulobacterales bacterium]|nr:DNA recombination protein RmuC [Caulobacterales bacterium]MCA0372627.1 DNA recombination protein RmuC [Pseudomonadota bacterium]
MNISIDTLFFTLLALIVIGLLGLIFAFFAYQNAAGAKNIAQNSANDTKTALAVLESALKHNFQNLGENSLALKADLTGNLSKLDNGLNQKFDGFTQLQSNTLATLRSENLEGRQKQDEAQKMVFDTFAQSQSMALHKIDETIKALVELNEKRGEVIRETLTTQLTQLRKENEEKLEKMRQTVDEKLQGTLEQRLGESFKLVSDRLDLVHKGLGEMQNLATGVGDLKKVLTNVKSRGTWGEVQLEMLLDDMLHRDQYEKNAKVNPEKNGIVEFAIKLPGKFEDVPVYLPIDAKFPQEDYERLVIAQENGTPEDIDKAEVVLERAIRLQAKTICEKYIAPPHTTDFAIMYLPTEGLFAEVVRKAGFTQSLQSEFRIMVTGPTTLAATLSSLQMGFRTLAIEKRSSEVWQILGAAKSEFSKYGEVWDKLKKQLESAQNTVDQAGRRTRVIERKLRDVEAVELPSVAEDMLVLPFEEEN